jgi:hypothetical protein
MTFQSSASVRIQAATTASGAIRNTTEDHWSALGFALAGLLAEAWGMRETRLDTHPAVDTESRYDVVCTSPVPEPRVGTIGRIRRAIAHQLQLSITTEARSMEIWVLTAPADPVVYSPAYGSAAGGCTWNSDWASPLPDMPCTPGAIEEWLKSRLRCIPAIGEGFPRLQILPFSRGLLMLDDAGEDGSCPVQIESMGHSEDEVLHSLREELGLTASKEHRSVEMLVVRPLLQ